MFKIDNIYINTSNCKTKSTGKIFRIYKNPNARDLFIKAQNAATVEEREKLFDQMGEYEVITETKKQPGKSRLVQFLKGLFSAS